MGLLLLDYGKQMDKQTANGVFEWLSVLRCFEYTEVVALVALNQLTEADLGAET